MASDITQTCKYEGKFIKLMETPNGWEYVTRRHTGVAAVLPLEFSKGPSTEIKTCLVRQWRPIVGKYVLALVAGLKDDTDPTTKHAAIREAKEESGYELEEKNMHFVGSFPSSSGLTDEIVDVYVGLNANNVRTADWVPDPEEGIEVIPCTIDNLEQVIRLRADAGDLIDSKIYAAMDYIGSNVDIIWGEARRIRIEGEKK